MKVFTNVNLGDLNVKVLSTMSMKTGEILLEIDGEDKAALLEGIIMEVVGESLRVKKPERRTPVLILNVPDWADDDEVASWNPIGRARLDQKKPDCREIVRLRLRIRCCPDGCRHVYCFQTRGGETRHSGMETVQGETA